MQHLADVKELRTQTHAAALEVATPPLSLLGGLAVAAALASWVTRSAALPLALLSAGLLGAYVVIGLVASRASLRDVAALRGLPRFLAHKLQVYARLLRAGTPDAWLRTQREERP